MMGSYGNANARGSGRRGRSFKSSDQTYSMTVGDVRTGGSARSCRRCYGQDSSCWNMDAPDRPSLLTDLLTRAPELLNG